MGFGSGLGAAVVSNSTFKGCMAESGGGIWVGRALGAMPRGVVQVFDGVTVTGCRAVTGGGVFVTATDVGGTVSTGDASVTTASFSRSVFTHNLAERGGGVLVGQGSHFLAVQTELAFNTAGEALTQLPAEIVRIAFAGSMCSTASVAAPPVSVGGVPSTFRPRSLTQDGGAVMVQLFGTLGITNCSLHDNEAYFGGAIGVSDSKAIVVTSDVARNRATASGGAMHVTYTVDPPVAFVRLEDATLEGNEAGQDGGAIWSDIALVVVQGGTLCANVATRGAHVCVYALASMRSCVAAWLRGCAWPQAECSHVVCMVRAS